jgi:hypothetical protein
MSDRGPLTLQYSPSMRTSRQKRSCLIMDRSGGRWYRMSPRPFLIQHQYVDFFQNGVTFDNHTTQHFLDLASA